MSSFVPSLAGNYLWTYASGSFPVTLRPTGVFYCAKHQAAAKWYLQDQKLIVDWSKYGKYEFASADPNGLFTGSLAGTPSSWRTMQYTGGLNEIDSILLGNGGGSVWSFEYEKGAFEVEFRCDAFNHFICTLYPAHSHWTCDGNVVSISWGSYGNYDLTFDPTSKALIGYKRDNPSSWRRATYLRPLGPEAIETVPSHDHSHHHVHHEGCGH